MSVPHAVEVPDQIPKERYYAPDFYALEAEQLWPRVWQMACRLEEIPAPRDFTEYEILDQSTEKIVQTVLRTQAKVLGPVPLPTDKHRYTVIRSPHKYKDSREHFEMRVHKRLVDIVEHTPKTVDSLQRLDLPAGVDIEIKIQTA